MPEVSENASVTYSVKELLEQIQHTQVGEFSAIRTSLDTKADKSQIDAIHKRLDEHGHEIGLLKDRQREETAATQALADAQLRRRDWRRWAVGTVALIASSGLAALITVLMH